MPRCESAIARGEYITFKGLQPSENHLVKKMNQKLLGTFEGFSVDAFGITSLDDGKRIAWKDVTDCGIAEKAIRQMPIYMFHIAASNISFETNVGLLCNAHVLLELCSRLVTKNRRITTLAAN